MTISQHAKDAAQEIGIQAVSFTHQCYDQKEAEDIIQQAIDAAKAEWDADRIKEIKDSVELLKANAPIVFTNDPKAPEFQS